MIFKRYRPTFDRILVVRNQEDETYGGTDIQLPGKHRERPQEGTVIAIGPGKVLEDGRQRPVSVKEGDVVLFGRYSGADVEVSDAEETTYLILREDEIMAVVELLDDGQDDGDGKKDGGSGEQGLGEDGDGNDAVPVAPV